LEVSLTNGLNSPDVQSHRVTVLNSAGTNHSHSIGRVNCILCRISRIMNRAGVVPITINLNAQGILSTGMLCKVTTQGKRFPKFRGSWTHKV